MKNKEYYQIISNILRQRGFYDRRVWKYSLLHGDIEGFKEYINDTDSRNTLSRYVEYLNNSFICLDNFKLLEYYPLVNPRTFSL